MDFESIYNLSVLNASLPVILNELAVKNKEAALLLLNDWAKGNKTILELVNEINEKKGDE